MPCSSCHCETPVLVVLVIKGHEVPLCRGCFCDGKQVPARTKGKR